MKTRQQIPNPRGQGAKPAMHVRFDPDVRKVLEAKAAEAGVTKARYLNFLVAREGNLPGHELAEPQHEGQTT